MPPSEPTDDYGAGFAAGKKRRGLLAEAKCDLLRQELETALTIMRGIDDPTARAFLAKHQWRVGKETQ